VERKREKKEMKQKEGETERREGSEL